MANARDEGRIADMTEAMQAAIAAGGGLGGALSIKVDPASLIPILAAQTTAILDGMADIAITPVDNSAAFAQVRADIAGIVIPPPVSLAQVISKLDAIAAALNITPPTPNVLPVVGLTSAVLVATEPGSALATVTASDSDGSIVKVELFKDGDFFAVRNQAPFTFSLTGLVAGTYQLTAKAYDNATPPGIATSAVSLVTINPAEVIIPPPPQVTPIPLI